MAAQTGLDFEGEFNNALTGQFKNNTTRDITPTRLRLLPTAVRESYVNRLDDPHTWAFPRADITGTTAYTGTLSPAITAYSNGMKIHVKAKDSSTGGVTLNLNGVGAKQVWINSSTQASTGDLVDEMDYIMSYDASLNAGAGVWLILGAGGGGGATAAADVTFTPAGNIAATDVQAAIEELDSEKQSAAQVQSAITSAVAGLFDDRGNFDASVNAYPSSGGSGTAGAILKGDIWLISVAGTLPTGVAVQVGDTVRALVDTPGNTQANWAVGEGDVNAQLALKAPLASPALTGTPTAPTAAPGTGGTQIATQAYADAANIDLVYTASGTNTYTASPSGITTLTAGIITTIHFTNANTALYPTINVNGLGARLIKKQINVDLSVGDIGAGSTYQLYYNGTFWQILNDVSVRRFYNVERYGARHDYRTVSDANVTSGTATLTSATAAFTTNDTGKSIRVFGAGAAGVDLITTITFVNATTVTLGTNASTTISAKQIEYGTDNTGPIQSAINACFADGGGVIYFPNGIYGLFGPLITLVDGVNPNAQIYIPKSYTSNAVFPAITFLGESIPNTLLSGLGNTGVTKVMTGAILKSMITGSGTLPSVIGSSFENITIGYNLTGVYYENISIQVKSVSGTTHVAPTMTAFNARVNTWAKFLNCAAFTESDPYQDSVEPTTVCYGFYLPQTSEAQDNVSNVGQNKAVGFNTGFRISEHELGGRFCAMACQNGFEFTGAVVANHPNYGMYTALWCKYDIKFSGPVTVDIDYYSERYGAGKWYQHTNDILFTSTPQVQGKINAHVMIAGGTHAVPNVSGAYTGNLKISDLYTNTDYYFNSATYTEEPSNGVGRTQTITRNGSYQNLITNLSTGTAATVSHQLVNSAKLTQWGMTGSGYTGSAFLGASGSFLYTDSPIGHSFWLADTGTPVFKIGFGATPTEVFRLTNAGRLFLGGSTTPTARLHIAAGTATASTAPLKFTSGTNLTTAENGAMEYNGTNLFFTRAGAVRENVVCASAVNSVSPTAPDRTITVNIDGVTLYISAKTTND